MAGLTPSCPVLSYPEDSPQAHPHRPSHGENAASRLPLELPAFQTSQELLFCSINISRCCNVFAASALSELRFIKAPSPTDTRSLTLNCPLCPQPVPCRALGWQGEHPTPAPPLREAGSSSLCRVSIEINLQKHGDIFRARYFCLMSGLEKSEWLSKK